MCVPAGVELYRAFVQYFFYVDVSCFFERNCSEIIHTDSHAILPACFRDYCIVQPSALVLSADMQTLSGWGKTDVNCCCAFAL